VRIHDGHDPACEGGNRNLRIWEPDNPLTPDSNIRPNNTDGAAWYGYNGRVNRSNSINLCDNSRDTPTRGPRVLAASEFRARPITPLAPWQEDNFISHCRNDKISGHEEFWHYLWGSSEIASAVHHLKMFYSY
jgi:hypothetical protein